MARLIVFEAYRASAVARFLDATFAFKRRILLFSFTFSPLLHYLQGSL